MKCRICEKKITNVFCDLGKTPLANAYLKKKKFFKSEKYYPLKVFFCKRCKLPQLPEQVNVKKIFTKYDYFSSVSKSWLIHCKKYVNEIIKFLNLNKNSNVCEIASNDGYLLQFFKKKKINVLGVEPAKNIAIKARKVGIPTIDNFFSDKLSIQIKKKYGAQDLIICNNVLAHVPDIKGFLYGIKNLLSNNGIVTFEFPHLLNLIKYYQFDTIYHEHFSYLSISCLEKLFEKLDLKIFDIKKIKTHGGSIRLFVSHNKNSKTKISKRVGKIVSEEMKNKLFDDRTIKRFNTKILNIKSEFNELLFKLKKSKKIIAAYGAAAKGNTFLNYCNIKDDMIDFVVDKNPNKIGKFLPGSHIKIYDLKYLKKNQPDYLVILPWNIKKEILIEVKKIINCKFIICIPNIRIY